MKEAENWVAVKLQFIFLTGFSGMAFRKTSSFSVVLITAGFFSGLFALLWQGFTNTLLGNIGLLVGIYGILFLTGHIIQSSTRLVYFMQRRARHYWGANIPPYTTSSLSSPQVTQVVDPYSIALQKFKRQSLYSATLLSITISIAAAISLTRPDSITWISEWWVVEAVGMFALILLRIPIALIEAAPFDFPVVQGEYNLAVLSLLGLNLLSTIPLSGNLSWLLEPKIEAVLEVYLTHGEATLWNFIGLTWTFAAVIYTGYVFFLFVFPRIG